ncbi:MAG: SRPBCC family protein [Gammaproteobacteria bacterium]|nr:SRPBCC family protein [Gammaproteobacteria bacterium]
MDFDAAEHLEAVERRVCSPQHDGGPAHAVRLSRRFGAPAEELWDALTDQERLRRWFMPVGGELRLGGRYQFEGNAGGTITACQPPSLLAVTWEFAGDVSWVEVLVSNDGAKGGRLTLTHTSRPSEHWDEYGPGATGVGWELGLLGLAFHIGRPSEPKLDEVAFATSPEGRAFIAGSGEAWGQAAVAAGTALEVAKAAAKRTTAFYLGE